MTKKVRMHSLFWAFWYQDQITVLKHLLTTNQLVVGYILNYMVSFTTNIKLVWFLRCYLSLDLPGLARKFHLNGILIKNASPIKLVDNCVKTFLNEKFLHTPVELLVEKNELFISLPYLGNSSLAIRTRLQNSNNKNLLFGFIRSR